jgi:hypothetical protein
MGEVIKRLLFGADSAEAAAYREKLTEARSKMDEESTALQNDVDKLRRRSADPVGDIVKSIEKVRRGQWTQFTLSIFWSLGGSLRASCFYLCSLATAWDAGAQAGLETLTPKFHSSTADTFILVIGAAIALCGVLYKVRIFTDSAVEVGITAAVTLVLSGLSIFAMWLN